MSKIKGLLSRFKILLYFLSNREVRKRTTILEVLRNTISPTCESIASRFITFIKEESGYKYFKIKGYDDLFLYPSMAPFHNFAQVISEGMLTKHWHHYEIPQTSVTETDIILDCGSAEGFFAFKYKVKAQKIYVVEPLPLFVNSLEKMFKNNPKIEVFPFALGSVNGDLYMELKDSAIASKCSSSNVGMHEYIKISSFTIDTLFNEKKISYIKADLEGFEEEVIKGALQTIKLNKPKIAITTYHDGQDFKKLIDLIHSVVPEYNFLIKGVEHRVGNPVMLHMWV